MRGLRDGRLRSTEQEVTRAATEAKQMPTQRIATQHLLHLQGQRWRASSHVGVTRRQLRTHAGRQVLFLPRATLSDRLLNVGDAVDGRASSSTMRSKRRFTNWRP